MWTLLVSFPFVTCTTLSLVALNPETPSLNQPVNGASTINPAVKGSLKLFTFMAMGKTVVGMGSLSYTDMWCII